MTSLGQLNSDNLLTIAEYYIEYDKDVIPLALVSKELWKNKDLHRIIRLKRLIEGPIRMHSYLINPLNGAKLDVPKKWFIEAWDPK